MNGLTEQATKLDHQQRHVLNEVMTGLVASKVIKLNDVVLDLGANVGYHTRQFADRVGPGGLVHAFEPNPALWSTLLLFSNIRLWPVAVGDAISVEKFILPLEHDQVGSIVDPRDFMGDVPTKILSVPQVTVDSLSELKAREIAFVKIDVERREAAALRGMVDLLRRDLPVLVYENDTAEIQAILTVMGYSTFDLLHFAGVSGVTANVVAVPPHKIREISGILPSGEEIGSFIGTLT